MSLQNLLDQLHHTALVLESPSMVPFHPSIVGRESALDLIIEDGEAVRAHLGVVLDVLNEPPCTCQLVFGFTSRAEDAYKGRRGSCIVES